MGGRGESVWEEVVRGCVWKGECGRVSVCVCVCVEEGMEGGKHNKEKWCIEARRGKVNVKS